MTGPRRVFWVLCALAWYALALFDAVVTALGLTHLDDVWRLPGALLNEDILGTAELLGAAIVVIVLLASSFPKRHWDPEVECACGYSRIGLPRGRTCPECGVRREDRQGGVDERAIR